MLFGAEVRAVEQLLQANDLRSLRGGLFDEVDVLIGHGLLDLGDRRRGRLAQGCLDQSAANDAGHGIFSFVGLTDVQWLYFICRPRGYPGRDVQSACTQVSKGIECARETLRIQIGDWGKRQVHIPLGEFRFPEPGAYHFLLTFEGTAIAEHELFVMGID
jgi:hypothetical protein